jgi:hypothetical protein
MADHTTAHLHVGDDLSSISVFCSHDIESMNDCGQGGKQTLLGDVFAWADSSAESEDVSAWISYILTQSPRAITLTSEITLRGENGRVGISFWITKKTPREVKLMRLLKQSKSTLKLTSEGEERWCPLG